MASFRHENQADAVPISLQNSPQASPLKFDDFQSMQHDPKKTLAIRVVSPTKRTHKDNGHLSPLQYNSGSHDIARPSPAHIGNFTSRDGFPNSLPESQSFPIPKSTTPTSSSQPVQNPRLVSRLSEDLEALSSPIAPTNTNQRADSPRIITPDADARPSSQRRYASHESSKSSSSHGSDFVSSDPNILSTHSELSPPLQYHHRHLSETTGIKMAEERLSHAPSQSLQPRPRDTNSLLSPIGPRPTSSYTLYNEGSKNRNSSPGLSPNRYSRSPSSQGRSSPDTRPLSYIDLLNVPYPQPAPAPVSFDKAHLQTSVGTSASLLSTKKTLEMYRANVKKTNDPAIQYSFAIFMLETAQETMQNGTGPGSELDMPAPTELIKEARNILQPLADRGYPFAQYYLADGYASGVFNKGKADDDRAFPMFVSASKHGHAEAGYRAALCYEFGWGTRKNPQKAVQFYRQSASKNHPGAMARLGRACLMADLGLGERYREGITWLKRATESADLQYNSAPYELGVLHETGYGDDIFRDETYAAQLFTQSADLDHVEANYRLGDAYEHGKLNCPRDPALSVHFYNGAASRGHALAMMALCAWYMVGAEPVLEKDENEAYEWAKKAAELGLPKAEYAVGYFTEMGIGCRRDPLEANVWYVRAADQGEERAKHRIAAIRAAAAGGDGAAVAAGPIGGVGTPPSGRGKKGKGPAEAPGDAVGKKEEKKGKKWGIF